MIAGSNDMLTWRSSAVGEASAWRLLLAQDSDKVLRGEDLTNLTHKRLVHAGSCRRPAGKGDNGAAAAYRSQAVRQCHVGLMISPGVAALGQKF